MDLNKKIGLVAGTASAALAGLAFAGGNVPATDTNARISALEQQLAELKQDASASWMSDEAFQALMRDAAADASQRTSLLAGGGHGGWDNGNFYLSSDDGSYLLNIGGLSQFRAVWNSRDTDAGSSTDGSMFGFENSLTYLEFDGNLFSTDFTYMIAGEFHYDGGGFALLDAWGQYQMNDTTAIQWGQFKVPFTREELMYEGYGLAVDSSFVNELTTAGYSQGVNVHMDFSDTMRFQAAFTDGYTESLTGPNGTLANTGATATGGNEYAIGGRFEWIVAGDGGWDQFDDGYTSWDGETYGTMVGAALINQTSEYGTAADDMEVFRYTVDAQMEGGTWNAFASYTGTSVEMNTGSTEADQWGLVVQGGFWLSPDEWELFGRWEHFDYDEIFGAGVEDELDMYTIGLNWYWGNGHSRKWTNDVVFADQGVVGGAGNRGRLADDSYQDVQGILRSQVQWLF